MKNFCAEHSNTELTEHFNLDSNPGCEICKKIIEDLKKHGVEIHVFGNHRSYINPILLFKIIILTNLYI